MGSTSDRTVPVFQEREASSVKVSPGPSSREGASEDVVVHLRPGGLADAMADVEGGLERVRTLAAPTLVVDLSAIERVSSTTVTALLWARKRCSPLSVQVMVQNPSPCCREALTRTGLMAADGDRATRWLFWRW